MMNKPLKYRAVTFSTTAVKLSEKSDPVGLTRVHFDATCPDPTEDDWAALQSILRPAEAIEREIYQSALDIMAPHARRGKKVLKGAKSGHAETHGDERAKADRRAALLDACRAVQRESPRWGLTAVRKAVAERFGVSLRTVERHTKELKTK